MRVVESEGCRYEVVESKVVESKVVESKFVEFMLYSRRGSSLHSHMSYHLGPVPSCGKACSRESGVAAPVHGGQSAGADREISLPQ